nr:6862_t:CDS:2 [Entrophospora candida]
MSSPDIFCMGTSVAHANGHQQIPAISYNSNHRAGSIKRLKS